MGSIVYALVSMVQVASLHCSMRPEISPCSCAPHEIFNDTIHVTCEGLESFNQVFDSLQNKFSNKDHIWLKITKSQLDDLETRSFKDMNMNITKLHLNYDDLRTLPESSFRNLTNLAYLSLADNKLEEIPRHILSHMPKIVTIDLAHGRIKKIYTDDFRNLNDVRYLILVNNDIKIVEKNSIPKTVRILHLGRNNLTSLNGTLRDIENMDVLFLNENSLTTLEDELPIKSKNFKSLTAHHNKLQKLTQDLTKFPYLDTMYISDNEIKSLDGVFKHASYIQTLSAHNNKIEYLAQDDFLEAGVQELDLANNYIKAINNSLLTLQNMRICNLSRNLLTEFSLNEIRGLRQLQVMVLSHNRIERLTGRMENVVEQDLFLSELRLDHNCLKSLDGAMMNLNKLQILDLSYNKLKRISPDDLIGLEELETLSISHNDLQTLEETSKTFLPKLETLDASYNNLTKLERDFHGLPALCFADLSNNHIIYLSPELVTKTRCSNHGVINKLEILLQENPILCMDDLSKLFGVMEAQETRLLGIAHCIVPKEEIEAISAVFTVPPIPLLPATVLNSHLPIIPNAILQSQPGIVQVIMPISHGNVNGIVTTTNPTNELENTQTFSSTPTVKQSLAESIATTTERVITARNTITATSETLALNPDENNVEVMPNAEKISLLPILIATTSAAASSKTTDIRNTSTVKNMSATEILSTVPVLETVTTSITTATPVLSTPTLSTSPTIAQIILGELESISKAPEPDNYIYETFSPVPQNIGPSPPVERIEEFVIVEEPPENLPNDAVPAA